MSRFIRVKGDARVEIDMDQIAEAERWDGLHGVITNTRHIRVRELLERYRGGGKFHDHQTRPARTSGVPLDPTPRPRPPRHRLHGLRLCTPSRLQGGHARGNNVTPDHP